MDEELPAPCGRTVYTIEGPDGVRSHADNCPDCWLAELQQAQQAITAALALLDDLPERPHRPATHSPTCHTHHLACLTARLRAALTEGTQPA